MGSISGNHFAQDCAVGVETVDGYLIRLR